MRMEKFWGVFVFWLIGYGIINNGWVVFIVIELIDGVEFGEGRIFCKIFRCGVFYFLYFGFEGFL